MSSDQNLVKCSDHKCTQKFKFRTKVLDMMLIDFSHHYMEGFEHKFVKYMLLAHDTHKKSVTDKELVCQ